MGPKLRGEPPHGPRRTYDVVHKNWVSEDYFKLKKGPFLVEVVGDHLIGNPPLPTYDPNTRCAKKVDFYDFLASENVLF